MKHGAPSRIAVFLIFLFLAPLFIHAVPAPTESDSTSLLSGAMRTEGRAQTTWSGTQTLTGTYTIGVADEVVIQPCTVVQLQANERIVVDGRLTVLGTESCPVVLEASGLGLSLIHI